MAACVIPSEPKQNETAEKIIERIIENILTVSGAVTSIVILLIIVFLFKEGFGLFNSPAVESGYSFCVNESNPVNYLSPYQIKEIYDSEIENWKEIGGKDEEIELFRFEEIFSHYSEEEM